MILGDERQRVSLQRRAEAAFRVMGDHPAFEWTIEDDLVTLNAGTWTLSEGKDGTFAVEKAVTVHGGRDQPDDVDLVEVGRYPNLRAAEDAMYMGQAKVVIDGAVQSAVELDADEEAAPRY